MSDNDKHSEYLVILSLFAGHLFKSSESEVVGLRQGVSDPNENRGPVEQENAFLIPESGVVSVELSVASFERDEEIMRLTPEMCRRKRKTTLSNNTEPLYNCCETKTSS